MKRTLISSITFLFSMVLLTGIMYPLIVTGSAAFVADSERMGSIVVHHGKNVGSTLIGQAWTSQRYFHGRPSAIGYKPLPSGGSNRSISSVAYRNDILVLRDSIAALNGVKPGTIPADLVMASASGIDPHITQEAAYLQVERILKARDLPPASRDRFYALIRDHTAYPSLGVVGRPRVNLLLLNCALDDLGGL